MALVAATVALMVTVPLAVPSDVKAPTVDPKTAVPLKLVEVLMLVICASSACEFRVDGGGLRSAQAGVGGFRGQRDRAVEQGGDLREGAVCGLQGADGVGGVERGLVEGGNVGVETIRDGETGCVIRTGVDARTRGKAAEGSCWRLRL